MNLLLRSKGLIAATALMLGAVVGCNTQKAPDVTSDIRKGLDQNGYKDVSVSEDRDKAVVTLNGTVQTDNDKAQAESIAKGYAASMIIANQISVRPPGDEGTAKTVESDTDKAIEKSLDATLVKNHLDKGVSYSVKNGVVTLTGTVNSEAKRAQVERLAKRVPEVAQVVNELEVKNRRATSSS
jgi:hyperosmotically inducible protein